MKLSELTPSMLQKALEIYAQLAYPGKTPNPLPDFSAKKNLQEALSLFQNESGQNVEGKLHRYTLRLGNERYPFMKMVLQEVLFEGEYFLSVDAHDAIEVKPSFPDYAAWQALKAFNTALKNEIEKQWESQGLPTYAKLEGIACELVPENIKSAFRYRILVVDDEKDIRKAIVTLLQRRGYEVETACEGEEALKKISWMKPDLVIMDYEMPGLDGLATLERLRAKEETRRIKVLLATAGQISLDQVQQANAFLVKPFQRQVLISFVEHLLGVSN